MKILIMTGARPNFIKVAPLIYAADNARKAGRDITYTLVYAGSESDKTLEPTLFDDLQIAPPAVFLGVDNRDTIEITSRVMERMERLLTAEKTDVVIVVDDLASTMATAIVAKKHGIRLAHLVAGTRSFDINMPKEINRLVIDGLSDYLFTAGSVPGTTAPQAKIYNVGNILLDTLRHNIPRFRRPAIIDELNIAGGEYIVLTVNRRKLLADVSNLKSMLDAMAESAAGIPILAPLRDEAGEVIAPLHIKGIRILPPLGYTEFGWLTLHARVIITDSGNVAEEATFNSVPCITLNNYTE
ncbi:MAG: UDP-N-acetylglucosamine 2-epimerase, partial [Prevotella sp.]|nr:UDP-N-acetylglucosamine 2-epimerase [Prevotella sp.]